MPDKYVPREAGEVNAVQWLPNEPEAAWKMMDWIFRGGLRFSFAEQDGMVVLELHAPDGKTFAGGRDYLRVYPGNYLVARDWMFEVENSFDFEKAFRKDQG